MLKQKLKSFTRKITSTVKSFFDHKPKFSLSLVRGIFILSVLFVVGFSLMYYNQAAGLYKKISNKYLRNQESLIQTPEDEKLFIGEITLKPIDATAWSTYQNEWYGFKIQHPESWENNTQYRTATEKSAVYETIYKFRNASEDDGGVFAGYDVKVYSTARVKNLEDTNDVHKKEGAPEDASGCVLSEEMNFGPDNLHFQKVSTKEDNPCFKPAYFFSLTKGAYIFNIVPAVGESGERFADPETETTKLFPEYKEAVDSFESIPIVRPQAKTKPKITAPHPVSAKLVNGKLVCAKKKDKPRKSKQHKGKHLDMECCLDPDETPNPWCTY